MDLILDGGVLTEILDSKLAEMMFTVPHHMRLSASKRREFWPVVLGLVTGFLGPDLGEPWTSLGGIRD